MDVDFHTQSAEQKLSLPDASVDTIVITWTRCSIPKPAEGLRNMRRTLEARGQLLFIEHGRSRDRGVVARRHRIAPAWRRVAGGCHLNRKIDELISAAGFRITGLDTFYTVGPRPMTYTYQGIAEFAWRRRYSRPPTSLKETP